MAFPIEKTFVVAVSASALFDMHETDALFRNEGVDAYRKYQEEHKKDVLKRGIAFPFIRRMLSLNDISIDASPVEVVLFSQNSPESGLRVMNSISHYGLKISRGIFSSGRPIFQYLPSFNATIFLSANPDETRAAIKSGYAAGTVLGNIVEDSDEDNELRIAFDFDGVIADDSAERYYQQNRNLGEYMEHEQQLAQSPLEDGPVSELLKKISYFQRAERLYHIKDPSYVPRIHTSIVTARNAPAHERVVTTLKGMNIQVDELFLLGGIEKARVLEVMKPHMFFDDQIGHLRSLSHVPAVHIPFGIANEEKQPLG